MFDISELIYAVMSSELLRCLVEINPYKLSPEDKEELLVMFVATEIHSIRHHIALIFSDLKYYAATPFLINKIAELEYSPGIDLLFFALRNLAEKDYFLEYVQMICDLGYEARSQAYQIVGLLMNGISENTRNTALNILMDSKSKYSPHSHRPIEGSTQYFIENALNLLRTFRPVI